MKPLQLTVSGFGAYSDKTVIDFTKLGNEGLYLITGDTGAGKTTIFDAICYALYGSPSGENRSDKTIRSKYASDDTKTYVELIFKLHNDTDQIYKICRNPEYVRSSKRKNGTANEKKSVTLECPDRTILTKSSDVDNKIREIIGLDEKKFKQIIMIAQGDFLKVLVASTEERTRIFRDIFHTEKYLKLQNKLYEDTKISKSNYEYLNDNIISEINKFDCNENNQNFIKLKEFISDNGRYFSNLSEIINCMEKIISDNEESQRKLYIQLAEVQEKFDYINIKVGKAEDLIKLINNRDKVNIEIQKAEEQYRQYEEKYNSKKQNEKLTEEIAKSITRLEEKLPIYKQLGTLQNNKCESEKNINTIQNQIDKADKEYNQISDKLEKCSKELESLQNTEVYIEKCNSIDSNLHKRLEELDLLKKIMDDCITYNRKLKEKQTEFKKSADKYDTELERYNNLERRFLNAQAGILAEKLKDGEKCPVCGSLHHPEPARISCDVPTEDMVKNAEKNKNSAHNIMTDLSVEVGKIDQALSILKNQIKAKSKEIYLEDLSGKQLLETVTTDISETQKKINNNKELLNKYLKDLTRKKQIQEEPEKLISKQKQLEKNINYLNINKASETQKVESCKKQITELSNNLEYKTLDSAKESVKKMHSQKAELETELADAKKVFENSEKYLIELRSGAVTLNEQIKGAEKPNVEKLKNEQKLISEQKKILDKQNMELQTKIKLNKNIVTTVKAKGEEFDKAQKKYSALNSLSMTANATISGKEKIMLETYVQMEYFERMLERANSRFLDMSGGKYEFVHSEEADNKRSKTGLEINVIDHTNNTVRSAKSLSGGESFMASLSLALGLADEVQSNAGGIQIDTMFIDEGFGSLDNKALENAITVLGRLGESNRLVGIISHVAELKERINKQIIVTKDKSGSSTARIEI